MEGPASSSSPKGFTTKSALHKLTECIKQEIKDEQDRLAQEELNETKGITRILYQIRVLRWIIQGLRHGNRKCMGAFYCWRLLFASLLLVSGLILGPFLSESISASHIFPSFFILCLLVLNVTISSVTERRRRSERVRKAKMIGERLEEILKDPSLEVDGLQTPSLYSPPSDCLRKRS